MLSLRAIVLFIEGGGGRFEFYQTPKFRIKFRIFRSAASIVGMVLMVHVTIGTQVDTYIPNQRFIKDTFSTEKESHLNRHRQTHHRRTITYRLIILLSYYQLLLRKTSPNHGHGAHRIINVAAGTAVTGTSAADSSRTIRTFASLHNLFGLHHHPSCQYSIKIQQQEKQQQRQRQH